MSTLRVDSKAEAKNESEHGIPLLDLSYQHAFLRDEFLTAFNRVLDSDQFILGQEVTEFENLISNYCGVTHAIGVSSGTDAILVALMAEEIGPGDEVIAPAYSFIATGSAITRVGATPVFVDICPKTFNIDPNRIEQAITERTKAIVPVHLYGQSADMTSIMKIAREHDLTVIEDAAQAMGADHDSRRVGAHGDYGCFSFFPSKNLGGIGDGGLVTTSDETKADRVRAIRTHGAHRKYFHEYLGGNFRLDSVQAAILKVKLSHLDAWTEQRQAIATSYRRYFEEAGPVLQDKVALPGEASNCKHVYNQFVIRAENRDALRASLQTAQIQTGIYYPLPLDRQPCFFGKCRAEPCDVSWQASQETLALPIYPGLSERKVERIVRKISRFYQ
ncbi:DegT/DnrJ/EryC1/StrS family aminotransferase [Bremerella sp. T1]|uniref:DegT/DnrJ/EryC1/StrS family aminotransferase n=1 Tax=Bremerella sp. TYQ1 TaxID=3119568 RepID=UPI001CD034C7|nr:DegT/DnrJ/EryC1/StrS family aminotransferase [Bremerella volcania]UBM36330.1 DegT/DnrJ/EryC1/StrS family aminotransferase [Bremerella volcania]